MDRPTEPVSGSTRAGAAAPETGIAAPFATAEPRQRWRITFARDPVAPDAVGRAALSEWQEALAASGLPIAGLEVGGTGRPRLGFAAPLPAGCRGEHELVDMWLLERVPVWRVREGLADRMPAGHRWLGVEDVWLGAPALAGLVVGAEWEVSLAVGPRIDELMEGAASLVGARTLPRTRSKGGTDRAYDLRPLIDDVRPFMDDAGHPSVRISTRSDPALGAGRPEEVVLALAEEIGSPLTIEGMARTRILLADPPAREPIPAARSALRGARRVNSR